jgi:hypothetical protein
VKGTISADRGFGKVLATELGRAFLNRLFVGALLFGCLITLSEIVTYVLPVVDLQNQGRYFGDYPFSAFGAWIGGVPAMLQTELYYFILPLLVCIPFADSLLVDSRSGYMNNYATRTSARNYYLAKVLAVFFSAGLVGMLPLLLNFYSTSLLLPLLPPIATTGQYLPVEFTMWSGLFYSQPLLYIALYMLITFVFSGLIALVALLLSFAIKNRFVVILAPFIICVFYGFLSHGVVAMTGMELLPTFSPVYFLNPLNVCFDVVQYVIIAEFFLGLLAVMAFLVHRNRRDVMF